MAFKLFNQIFGCIQLEEVREALRRLDESWTGLLDLEQYGYGDNLRKVLDSDSFVDIVDECVYEILHNKNSIGAYLGEVDRIKQSLLYGMRLTEENHLEYESAMELARSWDRYFRELYDPMRSIGGLIVYHSRIRHLLLLAELYSNNSDKQVKTWRHLFEEGCRCIGVRYELEYIDAFFAIHDSSIYDLPLTPRLEAFYTLGIKKCWRYPLIDWEKDNHAQHLMRIELYDGLKYAELAYKKHKSSPNPDVRLHPYKINYSKYSCKNIKGRFQLQGNMNGFVAYRGDKNPTIVIGFSGTEFTSRKNWKTNITQYFGHIDPVYVQAVGLLYGVRMGKSHRRHFKNAHVEVYGHSLGGGLMQFSVVCNHDHSVSGYGYNSAGIDFNNAHYFSFYDQPKIWHLYRKFDYVFPLPGTMQLGKSVKSIGIEPILPIAHMIGSIRKSAGKYHVGVAEIANK